MATSRLEKIGNIFTRIQGLLKAGAMKPDDVPIFYEIYRAFPPLKQRKYMEEAPAVQVRSIFYAEDKNRALRDDSNTLYNLYDQQRVAPVFTPRQAPTTPLESEKTPPKDTEKVAFDWKELDLKH